MKTLDTKQARDVVMTLAQCIGVNNYAIDANVVRLDAAFDDPKLRHRAVTIVIEPNATHANPDYYEIKIRDTRFPVVGTTSYHLLGRKAITSSPFNGCSNRDVVALRIQALLKRDIDELAEWIKAVIDDSDIEIINIVDLAE